jgi:hypothetical protein
MEHVKIPRSLQQTTRDVSALREELQALLADEGEFDIAVRERTEQVVAALYRLEWAIRRDGHCELAI